MKTAEELKILKEEVENLNKKLGELTEDELAQVNGGFIPPLPRGCEKRYVMDATPPAADIYGELKT